LYCPDAGETGGTFMKKRWILTLNYIVLTAILASTILLFWQARGVPSMQILIGVLISVLYAAWGMIHHSMLGDLHPKIVVEYLLVGVIAIVLIITVVWV
jgi:hypothetical protein